MPGQGNKEREIWLHDDAIAYVGQWLEVLGARRGPMFRRIDRWNHIGTQALTPPRSLGRNIDARRKAASVDPLTAHDFRRTMVSELLEHGTDLVIVQHAAGHASPVTTAAYDRRSQEQVCARQSGTGTRASGHETLARRKA